MTCLEKIHVEPPAEAQEPADVVWRLHKALPGLKGGPVAWGTRIDGILGSPPLNFRRSRVDPCLWTNSEGVPIGRHMDDFIKTGPPMAVQAVTEHLERVAQLKLLVFWTSVENRHVSWAHSSQKYMVVARFRQTQKRCWPDCET